ncbi:MAG TPA: cytochrome c oxidase assembly protein, partial [Acidimicrobiales bacterium]|nr:cytochrome c oxidase assembly protein [Acidimicrobiales bacterium]
MRDDAVTLAHATAPPSQVWVWASPPPAVAIALGMAALAYAWGVRRLRRGPVRASGRHVAAFYAGLAAVALGLGPPLHALASTLFSAHMV